jgi:hypothetical protein
MHDDTRSAVAQRERRSARKVAIATFPDFRPLGFARFHSRTRWDIYDNGRGSSAIAAVLTA